MRFLTKSSIWILLVMIVSITISCEKDSDAVSIYEKISSDPNLSEFMNLLIHTKYDNVLKNKDSITVFAFQNDSWVTTSKDIWSEKDQLEVVKRHIVMDYCPISIFESRDNIKNLLGETVSLEEKDGALAIVFKGKKSKYTASISKSDIHCSNGYLNILSNPLLEINPTDTVVIEHFWINKTNWYDVLNGTYDSFYFFEDNQLQLESLRLDRDNSKRQILPTNGTLYGTYSSAYKLINNTNIILANVQTMQADSSLNQNDVELIVAQAKSLRAFAYYNLAMLWGNVIVMKEPIEDDTWSFPPQSPQIDVYNYALSEISEALDKLPKTYNNQCDDSVKFTKDAGLALKAEIELTLGRKNEARNTLSNVKNNMEFCYVENRNKNRVPIYNTEKIALYQKEAINSMDGIEQDWFDLNDSRYGYWAALKRLGKAREVTGCFEYELLMPFPASELKINHQLQQNPGY